MFEDVGHFIELSPPLLVALLGGLLPGQRRRSGLSLKEKRTPRPPAWVIAHAKWIELALFPGRDPVNMSGGVLSSNPIGASGMIRYLEAADQVRGAAGDYQVEGARVALGHAYGGASNYFAMWIVRSEPSPTFR